MYKCFTQANITTGDKYAMLFKMKKSPYGLQDNHTKYIVFTISQNNNYNGYYSRTYSLGTVTDLNGNRNILFKKVSGKDYKSLYCVYEETDKEIIVYVKAPLESCAVRLKIEECYNENLIEFVSLSKFNYEPTNIVHAIDENTKTFIPTFQGTWSLRDDCYSEFSKIDDEVTIKCVVKSGTGVADGTAIMVIPEGFRTKTQIITYVGFTDTTTTKNICMARVGVLVAGGIVINGMNGKETNNLEINIKYKI